MFLMLLFLCALIHICHIKLKNENSFKLASTVQNNLYKYYCLLYFIEAEEPQVALEPDTSV